MKEAIAVFLGGGLGSVSRFLMSKWLRPGQFAFPWGTFVANLSASLLLGILVGVAAENLSEGIWKKGAIIGFCGGLSTFSTFSNEASLLLEQGKYTICILYIFASLLCCITGVIIGKWFSGTLLSAA